MNGKKYVNGCHKGDIQRTLYFIPYHIPGGRINCVMYNSPFLFIPHSFSPLAHHFNFSPSSSPFHFVSANWLNLLYDQKKKKNITYTEWIRYSKGLSRRLIGRLQGFSKGSQWLGRKENFTEALGDSTCFHKGRSSLCVEFP